MTTLEWVPRKSLGPFSLGASLDSVSGYDNFVESIELSDTSVDLKSYCARDGALRLEVRGGQIESVSSEYEFLVSGRNVIDLSLTEIQELLGVDADEIDDPDDEGDGPVIADFTNLGLQLVIRAGRVVSATCY